MTKEEMITEFLCPGCVAGMDTTCGHYNPAESAKEPYGRCEGHVLGTSELSTGNFALGMPKGFNKPGMCQRRATHNQMYIRVWPKRDGKVQMPEYDWLNVPVWAMERDGFLFVRVAQPRVAGWMVDVVEGGHVHSIPGGGHRVPNPAPGAIDVTDRQDEYD